MVDDGEAVDKSEGRKEERSSLKERPTCSSSTAPTASPRNHRSTPGAFRVSGVRATPEDEVEDEDDDHLLNSHHGHTSQQLHQVEVCEPEEIEQIEQDVRRRILDETIVAEVVGGDNIDQITSSKTKETPGKKTWLVVGLVILLLGIAIIVGAVLGSKRDDENEPLAPNPPTPAPATMSPTTTFRSQLRSFLLEKLPYETGLGGGTREAFEDVLALLADEEALNDTVYDMFTLMTLFYNNGGEHWLNSDGWGRPNMCIWYGVTCNENGTLSELRLPNNNMTGPITVTFPRFSESITVIDWSSNSISLTGYVAGGSKFSELVYLNLSQSTLHNDASLFDLPHGYAERLEILDLSHNNIYGNIPSLQGPASLEVLNLNDNSMSGGLNGLDSLQSLREVHLENNDIKGSVTTTTCSLPNLTALVVDCNDVECSCCSC